MSVLIALGTLTSLWALLLLISDCSLRSINRQKIESIPDCCQTGVNDRQLRVVFFISDNCRCTGMIVKWLAVKRDYLLPIQLQTAVIIFFILDLLMIIDIDLRHQISCFDICL
jgi:hypothetical protein